MSTLAVAKYIATTFLRVAPDAPFEQVDPPHENWKVVCGHGFGSTPSNAFQEQHVVLMHRSADGQGNEVTLGHCTCGKVYWQP